MSKKANFPQRLDIKDMPRDRTRALGGLRQALAASFNYCRRYPDKLKVLKEVLKYTYNRIVELEKYQLEVAETKEREAILSKAAELEIDLDERLSNDKLAAELSTKAAEKAATAKAEAAESAKTETKTKNKPATGDKK